MDPGEEQSPVPTDVVHVLRDDPDVEFALAFGSRADGTERPSSDIDVAVRFSEGLSSDERFRKRCRLSGRLQGRDVPFVDLSDLDELPIEFARAAVDGTFLCGDREAYEAVAASVEDEFERRREEIEDRQRETIRRIARQGLHG